MTLHGLQEDFLGQTARPLAKPDLEIVHKMVCIAQSVKGDSFLRSALIKKKSHLRLCQWSRDMLQLDLMDRHPQNEGVTAVRRTGDKRSSQLVSVGYEAVGRLADGSITPFQNRLSGTRR